MKSTTLTNPTAASNSPADTSQIEPHIGCIASAMEIIGNKWTALLLRDLASGPKRFGELEKSLTDCHNSVSISPRTLSQRLDDLAEHSIISRQSFSEVPPRCEYTLTTKGQDLLPILRQMAVWGEKYYEPDK